MNAVWIVDDDRSIRWVLEKALTREEIPYKSFGAAAEVLAALEGTTQPPQVLVSDIRMPGESGLSLLSKVNQGTTVLCTFPADGPSLSHRNDGVSAADRRRA